MVRLAGAGVVQREFTASATHCGDDPLPVPVMPGRRCEGLRPHLSLPTLLTLALCAFWSPSPLPAQEREERPHARLPDSVRRIERETGGKVLQVRPIQRGDREISRMKVLTPDGRVRIVQDDPKRPREREPGAERDSRPEAAERRRHADPPPDHF